MPERTLVAVKAPVFSTVKLTEVDTALGPEMKSTGEVMGIDLDLGAAPAIATGTVERHHPLFPAVRYSVL